MWITIVARSLIVNNWFFCCLKEDEDIKLVYGHTTTSQLGAKKRLLLFLLNFLKIWGVFTLQDGFSSFLVTHLKLIQYFRVKCTLLTLPWGSLPSSNACTVWTALVFDKCSKTCDVPPASLLFLVDWYYSHPSWTWGFVCVYICLCVEAGRGLLGCNWEGNNLWLLLCGWIGGTLSLGGGCRGLVADRIRRSKVEEHDSSGRIGWMAAQEHSSANSIVASAVSKLQREQRRRGFTTRFFKCFFNQWKSWYSILFFFFFAEFASERRLFQM